MKRKSLTISLAVMVLLVAWPLLHNANPIEHVTEEQIEQSILSGLLWLVGQQDLDDTSYHYGSWGADYHVAKTAFAVLKLETYAVETGQLNEEGKIDQVVIGDTDYFSNLELGLDYLTSRARAFELEDPDGNDDDRGIFFQYDNTYYTSIALMAIAASTHPEWTATVDSPADGGDIEMTYEVIVQNTLDYLVWGQNDGEAAGEMRGGWGYRANHGSVSDQSNSGYAVLGLAYAQAPLPHGFGLEIPEVTKDELSIWIDRCQCDDGGSIYYPGYTGCYWVNTLKTGNLLFQMALAGDTKETARVQSALSYIEAHWYDTDLITGWGWNDPSGPAVAQYQAAYCLMKGLEAMNVGLDEMSEIDNWYQDLADVIVAQQNIIDGSWPSSPNYVWPDGSCYSMSGVILSTEWALLTLERAAPPVSELQVYVDIKPGSCPNPLNTKSKGVLPVAILGTVHFDVTEIDPASVALTREGYDVVSPIRWSYEDVATPFEGELCDCHDLNGDGHVDLTLKFDIQEVVDVLGLDSFPDETIPITLIGNLMSENGEGLAIIGSDCIWVLKTGKK
ncbi:MAG: hypothetical protein KAV87_50055 [Desulfobacteraceae bacterium]|nr:hypothetical protein [Desulfobacteraceae bacterium]